MTTPRRPRSRGVALVDRLLDTPPRELDARLLGLRERARSRAYAAGRRAAPVNVLAECDAERLSWVRRTARLTHRVCEAETPTIDPDDRLVFTRTVRQVPAVWSEAQWQERTAGRRVHELGPISNICADWGGLLADGLAGRRRTALATRQRLAGQPEATEFLDAAVETIDAVLDMAARYAAAARAAGRTDVAETLEQVPAKRPRGLGEALQALRLCHAVLWLSGHYHCGLGRFDQYLWPYLEADLAAGRLTLEQAEDLVAEFFISLNRDSDLYPGVQQGDNGQSLMLGGTRPDGRDAVNPLTVIALRAARAVALIDPKINLRVTRHTDVRLLRLGVELTRLGLGFPQYANDDVVIPGLVAAGYEPEDARNYTVAACWEFIIPGRGMEIVNIGAVSFPAAVDLAIRAGLAAGEGYDGILARAAADMRRQVNRCVDDYRHLILPPAPYYSVLMDGCLEQGRDLSTGLRYNNFGVHGAASANAADALAAVCQFVLDEKRVSADRLRQALDSDYADDESLRQVLRNEGPKVGNHDERADRVLADLFRVFAEACEAVGDNGRGGRVRPGTGSAMYYVWLARGHAGMREPVVGATADGRKRGEFFSSSLAPSPGVPVRGPFSVLQSFANVDYRRVCNGGPITLELSDTVFRGADGPGKVALLVQSFADLGCQQLQLNTLNVDALRDARLHPERHRDLIVRVWGWSGYFCELDTVYQDHIIARHVYGEC